jgi:hypothetical protein
MTKSDPDVLINIFTKRESVNQFNAGWGYGWGWDGILTFGEDSKLSQLQTLTLLLI